MGGYSGGNERPLTAEDLELQRGDALKVYQKEVQDLQEEIKGLRGEIKKTLEKKEECLNSINADIKDAASKYTAEAKRLRFIENSIKEDIQALEDECKEKEAKANGVLTDFKEREDFLAESFAKLNVRKKELSLMESGIETKSKALEVLEDKVGKQSAADMKVLTEANKDLEKREQSLKELAAVTEQKVDYCKKTRKEIEDIREMNRSTLVQLNSTKDSLRVSEDDLHAFKKRVEELKVQAKQNKDWHGVLQQQEADLKLVDQALDHREREISQREKLYKHASQGGN